MRNTTILLAVVAVLALTGSAWADEISSWKSGTNLASHSWFDTANWTNGMPDKDLIEAHIQNVAADYCEFGNSGSNTVWYARRLIVGTDGVANNGYLTINNTYGTTPRLHAEKAMTVYAGATITHTAGSLRWQNASTMAGTYNFSGGRVGAYHKTDISGQFNCTGSGTFDGDIRRETIKSGGALNVGGDVTVSGSFHIEAGGTIKISGSGAGTATFTVKESAYNYDPGSGSGQYYWAQSGLLHVELDSSGCTQIKVLDEGEGEAEFLTGATLDVDLLGFTPTQNQVFWLLDADTITGKANLSLVNSSNWEIVWDDETNPTDMGVKYVPEPATLALLTLGGLSGLLRRRRR